jgi:hypothetical protein
MTLFCLPVCLAASSSATFSEVHPQKVKQSHCYGMWIFFTPYSYILHINMTNNITKVMKELQHYHKQTI